MLPLLLAALLTGCQDGTGPDSGRKLIRTTGAAIMAGT